MKLPQTLLLCVVSISCARVQVTTDASTDPTDAAVERPSDAGVDAGLCGCSAWTSASQLGAVSDPTLINEASGLVASRAHPGVLYVHNDSGDTARFFAITTDGGFLAEFDLTGATATDWEDIGLGPCPAGTCVFLGDIGDNNRVRTNYAVYRVTEPTTLSGKTTVAYERFPYQYPNGDKHNAEALFVHPTTGRVYLVTKEAAGAPSSVYRFPATLDASQTASLELVRELAIPASNDQSLTAADVSPCGDAVLMRMYNRLVEFRLPAGAPFEDLFSTTPQTVPVANEPQGEAVAYLADGRGYVTTTENLLGTVPLNGSVCR